MNTFTRSLTRPAALAGLALALLLVPAAGSTAAETKLSVVKTKPVKLGAGTPEAVFTSGERVWLSCPGKGRALMAGWTNGGAPIIFVYSHEFINNGDLGLAVSKPAKSATFRGVALCANGKFPATTKEKTGGVVSCSAKQIALGVPIDGGPILSVPVASKPVGKSGWETTGQGTYARSKVICVAASAFTKVKRIRQAAQFPVGKVSTTVAAQCPRGSQPISWGFEAGTLDSNAFERPGSSEAMTVPFIAAALPKGARGWSLTFTTPDRTAAKSSAPLAVHAVCAKPR